MTNTIYFKTTYVHFNLFHTEKEILIWFRCCGCIYFLAAPFFSSPFFVFVVPGVLLVLLGMAALRAPSLALWRLSLLPRTFSRLPDVPVLESPVPLLEDFDAAELGRSGDPRDEVLLVGLEGIPEDTRDEASEESSRDPVLPSDVWLSVFLTLDPIVVFFTGDDFSVVPFRLVPLLCLGRPLGGLSSPDFSRRGRSSPDFSRRIP